jgi:meso-butanediol dehydrogenase/(S,S)-butanediol dehydrogenase/diacetyl reductase
VNLDGKVAIVTAAGRGIGRGIALCLAEAGADLVVNSYSEDTTAATAEAVKAQGRQALAVVGDITQPDKIVELVESALDTYGHIDILVNNVGAGPKSMAEADPGPLRQIGVLWDALYQQNLRPAVLMTEAVTPHFVEQNSGKIINISSIAGRTSLSDKMLAAFVHPSYGAMKAGLINYTQTLAELLGPHNINVNAICPGIVYTDAWRANAERAVQMPEFKGQDPREWFDGIPRGDYPEIFDRTPLRRAQTVEDIGRAVVFLAGGDSINITGQSLMVDGGMVKI